MKAVVMAGGMGSRLRPLTVGPPKPMVPVANRPVLEHIFGLLKRSGIVEVVVTLQYMAASIQNYFGDGEAFGMRIQYSLEESPLGTAGSVKQARELLREPFLVLSGDALTDFDLKDIIAFHERKRALATLTLYRVPNPSEYGSVVTDEDGRIVRFVEKPSWGDVFSDTVNTGIYVVEPEVFERYPSDGVVDFSQDLFPLLLAQNAALFGYVAGGYWCDIGDHGSYALANADFLSGKVALPAPGQNMGSGIWCGDDVEIAPDAQLYGPINIGKGVKIKNAVVVHGPTIIGDYTVLDSGAHVDRSIIWRNSYIGERVEMRGAVICRQCRLKSTVAVFEGAVLGDNCVVGQGAVIHPNVRVWPDKEIEAGAIVKSSIIWGAHGRRVLFGRYGVTGLVNVDLTPEFAARLGGVFGGLHAVGAAITVNRDLNKTSRMIKRAIIAGLPASGVNVIDLESVPIPVARFYTRVSNAAGGVHVCLSPYDPRVIDIKFFDKDGMTIARPLERDIERAFFREDFRRVYMDDIGVINAAPEVIGRYHAHFFNALNVKAIRHRKFNIVVDYANASASLVLPELFADLGCTVITLNGTLDPDKMSVSRNEFERDLDILAQVTGATHADFGVRFDVGAERIYVVDGRGRRMDGQLLGLAMAELALRGAVGKKLLVPANASRAISVIAAAHDVRMMRAKLDPTDLMCASTQPDIQVAVDGAGHFVFPEFQPVADGLFAVCKLMELLSVHSTTLHDVTSQLPPYNVVHQVVPCAWEARGRLMRRFGEKFKSNRTDQIDGIRVELEAAWALILPDLEEPSCHIYAEGQSVEASGTVCRKIVQLVEELQQ